MRKVAILAVALVAILLSCDSKVKKEKYYYVETVEDYSGFLSDFFQKDTVLIEAVSDSAAYIEGFEIFEKAKKISKDMLVYFPDKKERPESFSVLNKNGIDVVAESYLYDVDSIKSEIIKKYESMPNALKKHFDEKEKENIERKKSNIDSVKVKKLKKYFVINKDEFSLDHVSWYIPKSAPKYVDRNGIYCYFHSKSGVAENLRLRVQYTADDWLFFNKIMFSIDGKAYEYKPKNIERDHGKGGVWEWTDEHVFLQRDIIRALANAKQAKMKFVGDQYHDVKIISKKQLKDIKRTLELFEAMGGDMYK